MFVHYDSLPRNERRAAQKLAKKLLRTTPAIQSENIQANTLRGQLLTASMKPKNLLAAFTYGDGKGNWWADVVLRKGQGITQFGVAEDHPRHSEKEALEGLKSLIAGIKGAHEHPIVAAMRKDGLDPEAIELLRVGDRYFLRSRKDTALALESESFRENDELDDNAEKFDIQELASVIVLQYAAKSDDQQFLQPPLDSADGAMVRAAASFLITQGIMDIDEPKGFEPAMALVGLDSISETLH
jgi:hypothetical protein